MINSGKLIHRVEWKQATETTTDGQIGISYDSRGTFWARVTPVVGQEQIASDKVQPTITHKVQMRKGGDIKPLDLLVFKSRDLQIDSVINVDEHNVDLLIMCREVV